MIDNNIPNPAFTHSEETDFKVDQATVETRATDMQDNAKSSKSEHSFNKYTFASLAIGEGASRYIAIFKKITQGKFFIPSVYAGIFGLGWLIYRRAAYYGFLAYTFIMLCAYQLITSAIFLPKAVQVIAIFAVAHIVLYFIGNFLYWYSVRKKIDSFRSKYGDTSAMTFLSEKGGVITGLNLITVVFMLQGGMMMIVGGCIYMDDFMLSLWSGFLELAHLKG